MIVTAQLKPGLISMSVTGKLEKSDIEAAIIAIEKERENADKISILVDLTRFSGFTPEAFLADLRYGISHLNDLKSYDRIAVITDQGWISSMIWLESKLVPHVTMRGFSTDERDDAMTFVKGGEVPPKPRKPGVTAIPTDRGDAYAFRITDTITHDDTKAMFARLNEIYQRHDKIDLLVIIDDFEGFEPSLLFDGETWSAKSAGLRHLRRYAVVGGPSWMRASAGFFGSFLQVEIKTFEPGEEADAWAWINAAPRDKA